MPKAFSSREGGIQPSNATGRDPKTSEKPKTGFEDSPGSELAAKGPGAGIGNSRGSIR